MPGTTRGHLYVLSGQFAYFDRICLKFLGGFWEEFISFTGKDTVIVVLIKERMVVKGVPVKMRIFLRNSNMIIYSLFL